MKAHLISTNAVQPKSEASRNCRSGWILVSILILALLGCGCDLWSVDEPKYYGMLHVYGSPYERGHQHGKEFKYKVHSLYTMLLTNSIFPYLNRERPDVASVMLRYQEEEYDKDFAYRVMIESANNLLETMPQDYIEEMEGIADGSEMAFDDILVLNTFFDTLMAFRGITLFIRLIQGPELLSIHFDGGLESDGIDNDGDGEVDELDEGFHEPYEPTARGVMAEVPSNANLRFLLDDKLEGANPKHIRIQMNKTIYEYGHPSITWKEVAREGRTIEVTFTPPQGFPKSEVVSIILQAGDRDVIVDPAPVHSRYMRDERFSFSTVGYGKSPWEIENRGVSDGRSQPPSIGFAVTGSATTQGQTLVGHNFAMLDSDILHKHTLMVIHHPDEGKEFAIFSWTGLAWGFSGINSDGLVYLTNTSDTLNNSFTNEFNKGLVFAKLMASGITSGFMGRDLMIGKKNVAEALEYLEQVDSTFGWNFLLADKDGAMAVAELDSDITTKPEGGTITYSSDPDNPENLDEYGKLYGSVDRDDIRVSSHYQKNIDEIRYQILDFNLRPQRYWSSFYFRSLRAFYVLGDEIENRYGKFDVDEVHKVLSLKSSEDQRDSMNSIIFAPEKLTAYFAMGQVPATSGPLKKVDLRKYFKAGDGQ